MRFPTLRVLCAAPVAAFLLGLPCATPAAAGEPKAQEIDAGCVYTPLVSGVTQSTAASVQATFNQQRPFWSAVGVRPSAGDDWDMRLFGAMWPAPDCVTDQLATSGQGGDIVDFVVGDFHHDAFGTRIAEFFPFSGVGPATIEWDGGADSITVNDLGTTKATGANDVLECFDVFLVGGKTYGITIAKSGNAAIALLLFRNPGPAPVWWARAEAQFVQLDATSQGASTNYTAQESNWYAIVVVNDNGLAGQYTFDVIEATAGVPEGATVGTRLVGIAPNPAAANTRVRFELARAGTVALELVDVAGRMRSRFDVGAREAGPSEATWNPGSGVAHAGPPGAGVYFLRLVVDGRPAGVERIVLL